MSGVGGWGEWERENVSLEGMGRRGGDGPRWSGRPSHGKHAGLAIRSPAVRLAGLTDPGAQNGLHSLSLCAFSLPLRIISPSAHYLSLCAFSLPRHILSPSAHSLSLCTALSPPVVSLRPFQQSAHPEMGWGERGGKGRRDGGRRDGRGEGMGRVKGWGDRRDGEIEGMGR